jgi:hypothetical protein
VRFPRVFRDVAVSDSTSSTEKPVDEVKYYGPFIGPWIEHSNHRYSRSWHPSLSGGGPAAVVQGHGPRFQWFAWHSLLGNASGEVSTSDPNRSALQEAMTAADKFLGEQLHSQKEFGPQWTCYPLAVTLLIEASPWTLARGTNDQWVRTWKDWSNEKALAARVTRESDELKQEGFGEFQWVCWGIYSEGHIGYGYADTFESAKEAAEATLMTYCQASTEMREVSEWDL